MSDVLINAWLLCFAILAYTHPSKGGWPSVICGIIGGVLGTVLMTRLTP